MTQHDEVNRPPVKKLTRIPEGKMVAGVCTGLADYLALDVTVVRLGVAVLSVITGGAGAVAYVVGMFVIPERGAEGSVPPPPPPSSTPSSTPPSAPPPSEPPPSAPAV
jgi:phage shock protein C